MQKPLLTLLFIALSQTLYAHNNPIIIGAREVTPSTLKKDALYASPKGEGSLCSLVKPCSIHHAMTLLKAGSSLFLRAGTYDLDQTLTILHSGTKSSPILIESYPGEQAILNGNETIHTVKANHDVIRYGFNIGAKKYITLKNLEIKNMGSSGVNILYSSYISVIGCTIHDNCQSGISIYDGEGMAPYKPYENGYNKIIDNILYNNSDAGLNALHRDKNGQQYGYREGDSSDGISISSGKFNEILHNTVYDNSDDGIDAWRSNNTHIAYNLVFHNGKGKKGNGSGIKAGGNRDFDDKADSPNGKYALVEHNIVFKNKRIGLDINSGKHVIFRFNTTWANGTYAITSYNNTKVYNNIALDNGKAPIVRSKHHDNSWQQDIQPHFRSKNINDLTFLMPMKDSGFEHMGAYAQKSTTHKKTLPNPKKTALQGESKIFLIGDSTVSNHNQGELGWGDALQPYLKHPKNLYNMAQDGATSTTYYKGTSPQNHDWKSLKKIINASSIPKPSYLLIQFGHNNNNKNASTLYQDLHRYIVEAKQMHLIPILITPVERFYSGVNTHHDIPNIIKKLAADDQVPLLDLHQKSISYFSQFPSHDVVAQKFGYDDHTHFNPKGAAIVAGWIKELICTSNQTLCSQFK